MLYYCKTNYIISAMDLFDIRNLITLDAPLLANTNLYKTNITVYLKTGLGLILLIIHFHNIVLAKFYFINKSGNLTHL